MRGPAAKGARGSSYSSPPYTAFHAYIYVPYAFHDSALKEVDFDTRKSFLPVSF